MKVSAGDYRLRCCAKLPQNITDVPYRVFWETVDEDR